MVREHASDPLDAIGEADFEDEIAHPRRESVQIDGTRTIDNIAFTVQLLVKFANPSVKPLEIDTADAFPDLVLISWKNTLKGSHIFTLRLQRLASNDSDADIGQVAHRSSASWIRSVMCARSDHPKDHLTERKEQRKKRIEEGKKETGTLERGVGVGAEGDLEFKGLVSSLENHAQNVL
jgi:hypothetical protein